MTTYKCLPSWIPVNCQIQNSSCSLVRPPHGGYQDVNFVNQTCVAIRPVQHAWGGGGGWGGWGGGGGLMELFRHIDPDRKVLDNSNLSQLNRPRYARARTRDQTSRQHKRCNPVPHYRNPNFPRKFSHNYR